MTFEEQIAALEALQASVATNPFDQRDHVGLALNARFAETLALLYLANDVPYPFNKSLRAISNALNDTILGIEKRMHAPIDVPVDNPDPDAHDAAVTLQIEKREEAMAWLDQARVASTLALVHMSKAIAAIQPPPLKAV